MFLGNFKEVDIAIARTYMSSNTVVTIFIHISHVIGLAHTRWLCIMSITYEKIIDPLFIQSTSSALNLNNPSQLLSHAAICFTSSRQSHGSISDSWKDRRRNVWYCFQSRSVWLCIWLYTFKSKWLYSEGQWIKSLSLYTSTILFSCPSLLLQLRSWGRKVNVCYQSGEIA